jgi:hypothetical protein
LRRRATTGNMPPMLSGPALAAVLAAEMNLSDWLWRLGEARRRPLVDAALALARELVAEWQAGVEGDELWATELASSPVPEQLLDQLETGAAIDERLERAVFELAEAAELHADEMSGSAEVCSRRDLLAQVAGAFRSLAEAVSWTEARATAGVPDAPERAAIARAGPSPQIWNVVDVYLRVVPGASEGHVRELVRRSFGGAK